MNLYQNTAGLIRWQTQTIQRYEKSFPSLLKDWPIYHAVLTLHLNPCFSLRIDLRLTIWEPLIYGHCRGAMIGEISHRTLSSRMVHLSRDGLGMRGYWLVSLLSTVKLIYNCIIGRHKEGSGSGEWKRIMVVTSRSVVSNKLFAARSIWQSWEKS